MKHDFRPVGAATNAVALQLTRQRLDLHARLRTLTAAPQAAGTAPAPSEAVTATT
jgi:hypothetical protein